MYPYSNPNFSYNFTPKAFGKVVPHLPGKWNENNSEAGSSLRLNSATGFPLSATSGANIAAGYTTEDVPITKHKSQASTNDSVNEKTFFYLFLLKKKKEELNHAFS